MTVYNQWLDSKRRLSNFSGLSTDTKPTFSRGLEPNVSMFTEMDTDRQFKWDGKAWLEMAIGREFEASEVVALKALVRPQGPP